MAGVSINKGLQERKIRCLLCVHVLEGHDRGLKYIAKKLTESGMEVVYIAFEDVQEIVLAAVQEAVDVVGVSSSTASHVALFSDLSSALREKSADDVLLIAGGIIPTKDISTLQQMGVGRVFGPGTHGDDVVTFITQNVKKRMNYNLQE